MGKPLLRIINGVPACLPPPNRVIRSRIEIDRSLTVTKTDKDYIHIKVGCSVIATLTSHSFSGFMRAVWEAREARTVRAYTGHDLRPIPNSDAMLIFRFSGMITPFFCGEELQGYTIAITTRVWRDLIYKTKIKPPKKKPPQDRG